MKVGDLIRVYERTDTDSEGRWRIGIVTNLVSFSDREPDQPVVLIDGKQRLYGHLAVEVVDKNKPYSSEVPTWLK